MRQIASFLSLQGDFEGIAQKKGKKKKKIETAKRLDPLRGQRRIYLCDPVALITKPRV